MAGLLAQRNARISDTITPYIRILLTAQDHHNERIDHGGSSGVESTRKDGWKRNMAEVVSALARVG